MAGYKVKELLPGQATRTSFASEEVILPLEVEILEKLKDKLPPGTFMVDAQLQVKYWIAGTPDEIKTVKEMWSKVYTWKTEVQKKEVELVARPLESTATEVKKPE